MKKVGLLLVVIVVFLIAIGCKNSVGEKRKIILWSFAPNNVQEYRARKDELEKKFNVELEIQQIAQNDFVQKFQEVLAKGQDVPDIIEWMIENNKILNGDPKKSLVIPLDMFVKNSDVFEKVIPGRVAWTTYGDHVYGLPHDVHPVVLIYNVTLWESAGVDVAKIKTWDEFFEKSKDLTAKKVNGKSIHYALPYGNDGLQNTMFMIWQQSQSQILDDNGKPQFDSAKFASFLNKWLEWQKSGAFVKWDWDKFSEMIADGTLASFTAPDWWIPQVNLAATGSADGVASALSGSSNKVAEVKYQFKARALPLYTAGGPDTASWGGSFMAIPRGTKDPKRIYEIMEYLEYDNSALEVRWEKTNMLPPISTMCSNSLFIEPDKRFGGQRLGILMTELAIKIPHIQSGNVFWDAINEFNAIYPDIESGKISVDDGLKAAQEKVMVQYLESTK